MKAPVTVQRPHRMSPLLHIKLLAWEFLHYIASGGSLHAVLQCTERQFKF